jgi:hypothetical protein
MYLNLKLFHIATRETILDYWADGTEDALEKAKIAFLKNVDDKEVTVFVFESERGDTLIPREVFNQCSIKLSIKDSIPISNRVWTTTSK